GPANLLCAVRVAASDQARRLGCLVVMNEQIHAARFVRKTHASLASAFVSVNGGPLGWITEDRVFVATALQPIPTINGEVLEPEIRVALLKSGLGDDGAAVHALVAANFDGLVVEAAGGGHVRPGMADALELAAATIPVLMCSRTGAGATLANTYGFVGG